MFNGLLRMSSMGMVRYGTVRNLWGLAKSQAIKKGICFQVVMLADTLLFRWQAEPFEYSD